MIMFTAMNRVNPRQQGMGLIEIMIAMVLGLMLTIGMVEIFIANKQAYKSQDSMSRIQESGRFAMEIMARNIRMAGFQGCANLDIVIPNVIADPPPGAGFGSNQSVLGWEKTGPGNTAFDGYTDSFANTYPVHIDALERADILEGTDVITVNRASDCGAYLVGNLIADNANIQLNPDNTCEFAAGEILIISDCVNTDIFRATNVSQGAAKITIAHANNMNTTNRLSKPYGEDAQIYKFIQLDYFVKENDYGRPALFEIINGGPPRELVEGIEDMQAEYGEDTTDDLTADRYVDAPDVGVGGFGWGKLTGLRLTLDMRSIRDNVAVAPRTITYKGDAAYSDKRLEQSMAATIGLRNRAQ
ncbi:MAG: PilW family protein [Candidatus Sedimenticola sp. 20ELBAFRAG]